MRHGPAPSRLALAVAVAVSMAGGTVAADDTKAAPDPLQDRARHAKAERNHRGGSMLERILDHITAGHRLDAIIRHVERAAADGHRPVVVFDIDDTLIKWKKVNGQKTERWSPMPGGVRYLRALERAGAQIVYLTARPESAELRDETLGLLEAIGAPLGPQHEMMMNPPGWEGSAAGGKELAEPRIRAKGRPLAFFDNDMENVRLFRRQYPDAVVFRAAGHSASPDPELHKGTDGVQVVNGFAASRLARHDTRAPRRPPRAGARGKLERLPRRPLRAVRTMTSKLRAVRSRPHR